MRGVGHLRVREGASLTRTGKGGLPFLQFGARQIGGHQVFKNRHAYMQVPLGVILDQFGAFCGQFSRKVNPRNKRYVDSTSLLKVLRLFGLLLGVLFNFEIGRVFKLTIYLEVFLATKTTVEFQV